MKTIFAVWMKSSDGANRVEAFTLYEDAVCYADMMARGYCRMLEGVWFEVTPEAR